MSRLIIINPVSGKGQGLAIFQRVKHLLNTDSDDIVLKSEKPGHLYEMGRSMSLEKVQSVLLVGGDGTMHEFMNGMMDRTDGVKKPIGLIPAGTGNSLMHDLNALDPVRAVENINRGGTKHIDIAEITCEDRRLYAFNVIGWGIPSNVNQNANRLKIFKGQKYNVASLIEIVKNHCWDLDFTIDGVPHHSNCSFFMACNTIHTGNGMRVAPNASLTDGKFDIIILKRASRVKLIKLFSKIFSGGHIDHPLVQHFAASEFSLREETPSILIVDGQVVGSTPFRARVLPGEIEVYC